MKKVTIAGILMLLLLSIFTAFAQRNDYPPFQQEFLDRINAVRQRGCNCGTKWFPPAPPLVWNPFLAKAAYGHARDMDSRNYFSHTSKDGRSMEDRIVLAGYTFKGWQSFSIGENIAMGQTSIAQVTDEWFKSEGHCHNLMNPSFKEIGIVQYNKYWVEDFGGRIPFTPEQQKIMKENGKTVAKSN